LEDECGMRSATDPRLCGLRRYLPSITSVDLMRAVASSPVRLLISAFSLVAEKDLIGRFHLTEKGQKAPTFKRG
jgi:hypothetical protein